VKQLCVAVASESIQVVYYLNSLLNQSLFLANRKTIQVIKGGNMINILLKQIHEQACLLPINVLEVIQGGIKDVFLLLKPTLVLPVKIYNTS